MGQHFHNSWMKSLLLITGRKGQGNVFTGVCNSVHGGGGCLPQCMLGYNTPRGADTPLEQTTPPEQTPLKQTPPRADTPPRTRYTPGTKYTPQD